MTANTNPIFTLTPVVIGQLISTANTNRDGSGTLGHVISGGVNGTRISKITIQASGSTAAGMVRLFIDNSSGSTTGSSVWLWKEDEVDAIAGSASAIVHNSTISLVGETALILPYGFSLKASTHYGENFYVIAEGGDY